MNKTTIATMILFAVVLGLIACNQQPTPSILATPTQPVIPIQTATLLVEPEPTVTVVASPTPVSVTLSNIDFSQINSARFVTTNTVAYLDQGDLYVYDLTVQIARRVTDGGNVDSFDWSKTRQSLVAAKDGHLLLLDDEGKPLADLSAQLAFSSQFKAPGCDVEGRLTGEPVINGLEHVKWVKWSPDQNDIVFASDIDTGDEFCYSRIWSVTTATREAHELGTIIRYLARPRLLSDMAVMLEHYRGGGHRTFDVVGIDSDKALFSVETWASIPVNSPDGHYLAARTGFGTNTLEVYDVATQPAIYHGVFTDTVLELLGWSDSSRYFSLFETNLSTEPRRWKLTILDVKAKQLWRVQELAGWPTTTWTPGKDEMLMFTRYDDATAALMVNPADRSVASIGQAQNTSFLWPAGWSPSGRYLTLFATGTKDERSIWVWDNQAREFLAPIYRSPVSAGQAAFIYQDWSADDRWVLVVQMIQHNLETRQAVTDFALLAVDVSSGDSQIIARGATNTQ